MWDMQLRDFGTVPNRGHRQIPPVHTDVEAGLLKLLFHINLTLLDQRQ